MLVFMGQPVTDTEKLRSHNTVRNGQGDLTLSLSPHANKYNSYLNALAV